MKERRENISFNFPFKFIFAVSHQHTYYWLGAVSIL